MDCLLTRLYSVNLWLKQSCPKVFLHVFPNGWEFLVQIIHAYYAFVSMLDYKFLFNYLQLWWNYAILSVSTKHEFWPMVAILSIWCELVYWAYSECLLKRLHLANTMIIFSQPYSHWTSVFIISCPRAFLLRCSNFPHQNCIMGVKNWGRTVTMEGIVRQSEGIVRLWPQQTGFYSSASKLPYKVSSKLTENWQTDRRCDFIICYHTML